MHLLSDSKDCITPLWITVSVSLSLSSSRCHSFTFLYGQQDCDHQDESEKQEHLFASTEWQVSFTYFLVPTARLRPPRWVWCPTWQSWVSTCSRNACLCPLRGSSFSDCTTMCVRPQSACCTWPGSADSRNWCLVLVSPMAMTPRLSMWVKLCLYLQSESFPLMDFKATCYANLYKQNSTTSKSFFLLLSAPPPSPPCIPVIFLLCPIMPMCVCGGGGVVDGRVCVCACSVRGVKCLQIIFEGFNLS